MKIGNLKHGQTLKNIKELCEVLKIPYKDSTDSRKAIFKDLDRYCKYHKEGRKIVIDEIFQNLPSNATSNNLKVPENMVNFYSHRQISFKHFNEFPHKFISNIFTNLNKNYTK